MEYSRFTDEKTGDLVRITTLNGPDWSFVPKPLPPSWAFPSHLWPLLAEAREQLARLDEKGRTVPNPSLLLTPLQKREAIRSSSLEGTFATAKELLLYELEPREPTSREDKANEWREVYNYDRALKYGVRNLKFPHAAESIPLSLRLIRDMHEILLKNVRGNDSSAGDFRLRQVHVGSNRRYVPPPPGDALLTCLDGFEKYLHQEHGDYDPLVRSYLAHYQFEAIHPFLDGNGRIGRLLLALTTYKWSNLYLPWLYMSAFFERYKDEYVDNMLRVSTHGDWDRWIEYCLRGTIEQCRDAIRRCDKLNRLRATMKHTLDHYPRLGAITEYVFLHPVFSAVDLAKWCNVSMPTARRDIELLIRLGHAQYLSGERPRQYFVPKIYSAAYDEGDDADADIAEGGYDDQTV